MAKDADILADALEAFQQAESAEADNRERARDDIRFAKMGEQWPEAIVRQRQLEGRPCLTINRMPTFVRQVVNEARQNKPSIRVHPVDSGGDLETAEVFNGLIRHIEYASSADIAYDTAIDSAVSGGFGYWRIVIDYARDDSFDLDLLIEAVRDPFSVYGDPNSTSADGSDWESAFVLDTMPLSRFERRYPDAEQSSFNDAGSPRDKDDTIRIAEWWTREPGERVLVKLTDGQVVDVERLKDQAVVEELMAAGITVDPMTAERKVPTWKVRQHILSGADVLKTADWPGRYIPIVPVYGDEVMIDGRAHYLSLIHHAKDAQRMLNYWRTTGTELVALAPRVPYIGPKGAFSGEDAGKWATVNTQSHATIEYEGDIPPQRQPMDATAAGPMQQALLAADDIKATTGQFDASLGAQSNETSGKAILARQREGDVSTFHFIDNLTRAVRHSGRILIDLIPHVYSDARTVRIMGEDESVSETRINEPQQVTDEDGQPVMEQIPGTMMARPKMRTIDVTAGKYDLTVKAGPSYATKREETASQMMEFLRVFPSAAPVIGDIFAKNLDWPGADEIAERLKALVPQQAQGDGIPPELQQQIAEGMAKIQALTAENEALKADQQGKMAELSIKAREADTKQFDAETKRIEAETDRMRAEMEAMRPMAQPMPAGMPS